MWYRSNHQAGKPKTMIIQGINRANGQLCSLELNENQLVDVLYPLCQQWAHWIMSFIDSLSNEQKKMSICVVSLPVAARCY